MMEPSLWRVGIEPSPALQRAGVRMFLSTASNGSVTGERETSKMTMTTRVAGVTLFEEQAQRVSLTRRGGGQP